ncbi:hypothetical protein M3Y98_00247800 [Aphelenchoides besseyi]|nr:hypothetical protein M3Y98_00247800 [Aphelenchoides besseyi]KAI6200738.1 hypothetical protein M3Y96_00766000 [Aphelenchoides besseyi]
MEIIGTLLAAGRVQALLGATGFWQNELALYLSFNVPVVYWECSNRFAEIIVSLDLSDNLVFCYCSYFTQGISRFQFQHIVKGISKSTLAIIWELSVSDCNCVNISQFGLSRFNYDLFLGILSLVKKSKI